MYKFSRKSIGNLKHVHPKLIMFWTEVLQVSKYDVGITCGVRTLKTQQKYYAQGRTTKGNIITYVDGVKRKSKHQIQKDGTSHATDFKLYKNGNITWQPSDFIDFFNQEKVRELQEKYGLVWGGDWKTFKDYPHVQIK